MKKIGLFLAVVLMASAFASCGRTPAASDSSQTAGTVGSTGSTISTAPTEEASGGETQPTQGTKPDGSNSPQQPTSKTATTKGSGNDIGGNPQGTIPQDKPVAGLQLPKADIAGEKVTVMSWWTSNNPEAIKFKAQFKKQYNATLEWQTVGWGDYTTTLQRQVMSNTAADVVMVRNGDYPTHAYNKWWQPIDGQLDLNSDLWKGVGSIINSREIDGKHYLVTTSVSVSRFIWYNKNILTNEGQPDLMQLYDRGLWTWDKLMEVARAVTKDTDQDGTTDQFGIDGESPHTLANAMISAYKTDWVKKNGEKYALNFDDPKLTKSYDLLNELYNTYKVGNTSGESSEVTFGKGKLAMYMGGSWIGDADPIKTMHKTGKVSLVPFPSMPGETSAPQFAEENMYAISNCKGTSVKGAVAFINLVRYMGLDKANVEERNGEMKSVGFTDKELQMMDSLGGNTFSPMAPSFGAAMNDALYEAAYNISWGHAWSEVRQYHEGTCQQAVDDMNKLMK
jgi:carbohydrate ABC transporter substrate-binding protein, CUT1 family (TC 3.A.1.1.-)